MCGLVDKCLLRCETYIIVIYRVANFQTLVWDLRLFVMLQTFLLLFCTSHHKTTSKHPRIQEFWLYFAKIFSDPRQKQEKRPHPAGSSCVWAGLWLEVTVAMFSDVFETQCWQPWLYILCYSYKKLFNC